MKPQKVFEEFETIRPDVKDYVEWKFEKLEKIVFMWGFIVGSGITTLFIGIGKILFGH